MLNIKLFLLLIFTTLLSPAFSQSKKKIVSTREKYEIEKEMPVFLDKIKEELTYPLAPENRGKKSLKRWNKDAKEMVFQYMGIAPTKAGDYDMVVVDEEIRDGYTVKKIEFNITGYSRIPAYLLVPDGEGPFPAIMALHDHGAHFSIGKEKMVEPFNSDSLVKEDSRFWVNRFYDGMYVADTLAKNGYVVLAWDALFWGERGRKEGVDFSMQQALAANLEMLGRNWSSLITYEDIYAADFLSSLPFVDNKNVGSFGFSMGAYRSWMVSALSDDVKAGAALCWMTQTKKQLDWRAPVNKGNSSFSMTIPGLKSQMDYPHIASLASPKPMLFFNGKNDPLFPQNVVEEANETMANVWNESNAADKIEIKSFDCAHFCSKEMIDKVILFFNRNLKK